MTLSISPTEKKAVVKVLEEAKEVTAEELAVQIIQAFLEVRSTRQQHTVVVGAPGSVASWRALGSYPTSNAALKAVSSGVFRALETEKAGIVRHYPTGEMIGDDE